LPRAYGMGSVGVAAFKFTKATSRRQQHSRKQSIALNHSRETLSPSITLSTSWTEARD
jgi:hypothetical protein